MICLTPLEVKIRRDFCILSQIELNSFCDFFKWNSLSLRDGRAAQRPQNCHGYCVVHHPRLRGQRLRKKERKKVRIDLWTKGLRVFYEMLAAFAWSLWTGRPSQIRLLIREPIAQRSVH